MYEQQQSPPPQIPSGEAHRYLERLPALAEKADLFLRGRIAAANKRLLLVNAVVATPLVVAALDGLATNNLPVTAASLSLLAGQVGLFLQGSLNYSKAPLKTDPKEVTATRDKDG